MRVAQFFLATLCVGGLAACTLSFEDLSLGEGGAGPTGSTSSTGTATSTGTNAGGAGGASTTTTGANVGGGTTTGSGGGPDCGGTCAPVAPVGFTGPYLIGSGNTCPSAGTPARLLGTALAGTQTDCACQLPGGAPSCDVTTVLFTNATCSQIPTLETDFTSSAPKVCEFIPTGSKSGTPYPTPSPPTNVGACVPPTPPPAAYVGPRVQCDEGAQACDGGLCIGSTAASEVCVVASGDAACLAPYPTKTLVVSATMSCACGNPNYDCAGTMHVFSSLTACTNGTGPIAIQDPCTDVSSVTHGKFIPQNANLFDGKCGTPQATASTEQLTLCCLGP